MRPSPRQLEILALHSTGMCCAELAQHFHLSEPMIRKDIERLKNVLGARNLYHAQVVAIARGYLGVDGREDRLFVIEEAGLVAA